MFLYARNGREQFYDNEQLRKDNRLAFPIPSNQGRLWRKATAWYPPTCKANWKMSCGKFLLLFREKWCDWLCSWPAICWIQSQKTVSSQESAVKIHSNAEDFTQPACPPACVLHYCRRFIYFFQIIVYVPKTARLEMIKWEQEKWTKSNSLII